MRMFLMLFTFLTVTTVFAETHKCAAKQSREDCIKEVVLSSQILKQKLEELISEVNGEVTIIREAEFGDGFWIGYRDLVVVPVKPDYSFTYNLFFRISSDVNMDEAEKNPDEITVNPPQSI